MLGDKLSAQDAQRIGLIWRCVDDDAALVPGRRRSPTDRRRCRSRRSRRRAAIDAAAGLDYASALAAEARLQTASARRPTAEGVAAFMAKRKPRFTDR